MDLNFTESQVALRDLVQGFFEKESPAAVVRAAEPLGFDRVLWEKVTKMGLTTMTVPESAGGGGAGLQDLVIAAEHFGRCVAPVPLVEAAVTNDLLAAVNTTSQPGAPRTLAAAIDGQLLATLALRPIVPGVTQLVPAGAVADAIVALDGDRLVLIHQEGTGPHTPRSVVPNLGAMPIRECRLDECSAEVLAQGALAVQAYERARRQWELATAAALVGLGSRALEIGLEYVMQRRAFGVLIGTFQTIQHRFADDVTALEGARLLVQEAAWAWDRQMPSADGLATMAFLFSSEAAFKTAAESLQFHGGYGYTLEYDIQLYFRRAKAWPLIAGDPRTAYTELAHRLFDRGEN
jgi:alkylation response protein AidB-like acyl-CoA dehydrogenase